MSKQIVFNQEAKDKLKEGVGKLAKAVITTLGPNGRNVTIQKEFGKVHSTKDGVTVAKEISLSDPIEDMGAQMIKQASVKTVEQCGDGTTTSTVLAAELTIQGLNRIKTGSNAVEVKKGIDKAVKLVVKELKSLSKDIEDESQFKQVATISANNDEEIGNLVAAGLEKVGRDGVVTVAESRTGETILEVVEGLQFDRGYKSPHFVTNTNTMQAVLNDVAILVYDKKITQMAPLLPLLESIAQSSKSLLIIADDIEGEALSVLVVNKLKGTLKVVAVKAPEFGDRRASVLEDIAILTGATVVSPDKGMRFEKFDTKWFGQARTITVNKDMTTIIDGKGDTEKIQARMLELKSQLDTTSVPYEVEKLQERLGKMVGGVAIINVGGSNEIEIKEKKDRVDDALQATKAALEEGILPGGGIALLRSREILKKQKKLSEDQALGFDLVYNAVGKPFKQILENAGYSPEEIYSLMNKITTKKDSWIGFNPKADKIVNMFKEGIIDPTKVVRCALENAAGVAGTILITECVIVNEKSDKKDDFGGMNLEM